MRMRFKPYAGPELDAWSQCERHADQWKNRWAQHFARPQQPLHVELGCGKGGFLARLAATHPEINYMGVDMTDKVLILAKRNIETACAAEGRTPENAMIMARDIERITEFLGPQDAVQRIYINFCNPWNKKAGQTKHRLTHPRQLLSYRSFLAPGAEIWFKCDDDDLYDCTLEYLPAAGFDITYQTRDLHADEAAWPEPNVRTEHEQMFTEMGLPTHACIARVGQLTADEAALRRFCEMR